MTSSWSVSLLVESLSDEDDMNSRRLINWLTTGARLGSLATLDSVWVTLIFSLLFAAEVDDDDVDDSIAFLEPPDCCGTGGGIEALPRESGCWNCVGLYLVHLSALGSICMRLSIDGWEKPKNSGPEPALVACLSLQNNKVKDNK